MISLDLLLGHVAPPRVPAGAPVRRIKYVEPADDDPTAEPVQSYAEALVARRQRVLDALRVDVWLETAEVSHLVFDASARTRSDLVWLKRHGLAVRKPGTSRLINGQTGWWRAAAPGQIVPPPAEKVRKVREQKIPGRTRKSPGELLSRAEIADRRERVLLCVSTAVHRDTREIAQRAGLSLSVAYSDLRRLEFAKKVVAQGGTCERGAVVYWRAV